MDLTVSMQKPREARPGFVLCFSLCVLAVVSHINIRTEKGTNENSEKVGPCNIDLVPVRLLSNSGRTHVGTRRLRQGDDEPPQQSSRGAYRHDELGIRWPGEAPIYPPISESEARRFFTAKDFTLKVEQKSADDGKTLVIEAAFKDINALLASPYGRAHQLSLKTNGSGVLIVQALSGGSTLAQAAQFKPEGEMASFEVPGMEDAQKKKNEMRFDFRITLPNTVTAKNAMSEGKSVTWSVKRAKCKDDDEFATKLAGVLEASCSTEGLRFSAITPARLGLLPFNQLLAGKTVASAALPDTNKIMAVVRFVPYVLNVTRSLDLSGEGPGQASQAQLTGAILLPAELAPQRWGQVKLEEAQDAKGNSLLPKDEAESMMSRVTSYSSNSMNDDAQNEEQDETVPRKETAEKPHIVSLSFKAPEWKIKEIAKIKASVELQYLGGSEVIKLSNAVPANLVMDMGKRSVSSFSSDSEPGQISNGRLVELGLTCRVQMAMVQSGMTVLSLETGGGKAALVDAQVFDVDGRPWPTTLMQSESTGAEDHSCQIMVAGKPKPPFSLALAVGGVGASVGVPILVENVPVGAK